MLCPEVFNFPIPPFNVDYIKGGKWTDMQTSPKVIEAMKSLQFARMVSVVVPANERLLVDNIADELTSGTCSLYLVKQFPLSEMVRTEFLEAFVKRGKLHGISSRTRLETDDCAAISPEGMLLLSLTKATYQRIKSCSSSNFRKRGKYYLKIDLTSADAKKDFEQESLAFDMIIRWIPPNVPSHMGSSQGNVVSIRSIEVYLRNSRQIKIQKLSAASSKLVQLDETSIPLLGIEDGKNAPSDGQTFCTPDEIMEYIGLLVLDCNIGPHEFLSTYSIDGCTQQVDKAWLLHQQGLFTPKEVGGIISQLANFIEDNMQPAGDKCGIPWVALHVQGFPNFPLGYAGKGECGICYDYDKAYTIVINNQGEVLLRKLFGCSGRGPIISGDPLI
uniref:Uncharacterized protein n=1 Tax=Anopheles atroparvus TaxID=41427 RepID=A0A182JL25_ANOAO